MSTYDARLAVLEEKSKTMTQDIIYKFDETNSFLTALHGVVGAQGRDLKSLIEQSKEIKEQIKGIDVRLARSEVQLTELTQEVIAIKEQQSVQAQDIKQQFASVDQRFDLVLQALAVLTKNAQ